MGGRLNVYLYANGDPVNLVDPRGEFPWAFVGGAEVGGVVDFVSQLAENGGDIKKVDPCQVAVTALASGLSAAIPMNPMKVWESVAYNATGSFGLAVGSQVLLNNIRKDPWNKDLGPAVGFGFLCSGASSAVRPWVGKSNLVDEAADFFSGAIGGLAQPLTNASQWAYNQAAGAIRATGKP